MQAHQRTTAMRQALRRLQGWRFFFRQDSSGESSATGGTGKRDRKLRRKKLRTAASWPRRGGGRLTGSKKTCKRCVACACWIWPMHNPQRSCLVSTEKKSRSDVWQQLTKCLIHTASSSNFRHKTRRRFNARNFVYLTFSLSSHGLIRKTHPG